MDKGKIWLLLALVWLLWYLIDRRRNRPAQPRKIERFRLFRKTPADLASSIYHPKEFRRPRPPKR